jgi:hypothetical protein
MQFNTSAGSGMGYFGVEGNNAGCILFRNASLCYCHFLPVASGTALQLGTAGVVKMTLTSGGNVGIRHDHSIK